MKQKIATYAKEHDLTYYTMVKINELKHIQLKRGTILNGKF